jgi:hypothetical protein
VVVGPGNSPKEVMNVRRLAVLLVIAAIAVLLATAGAGWKWGDHGKRTAGWTWDSADTAYVLPEE